MVFSHEVYTTYARPSPCPQPPDFLATSWCPPLFFNIWFGWRPSRNRKGCLLFVNRPFYVRRAEFCNRLVRNALNNNIPFSHLLSDSGSDETFLLFRWDPADFHFDCFMWVQHLSYFAYKNLVVTPPFWVWGSLGLASMQLPVFFWIGVFSEET